jgi:hypothetical protein
MSADQTLTGNQVRWGVEHLDLDPICIEIARPLPGKRNPELSLNQRRLGRYEKLVWWYVRIPG